MNEKCSHIYAVVSSFDELDDGAGHFFVGKRRMSVLLKRKNQEIDSFAYCPKCGEKLDQAFGSIVTP